MKMKAIANYVKKQSDIKKVYLLNQDYAHGKQWAHYGRELVGLARPDIQFTGETLHPIGRVKDFAPYLAKIKSSEADSVITGNWGQDMVLLLKAADRLMARLATHVLADSASQRDFMIAEGIAAAEKIQVLGEGSICGADGERFRPDADRRAEVRLAQGIPREAVVFLFLGRQNRDKGVLDLADAFAALGNSAAWLLVVGPDEAGLRGDLESRLGAALARTRFVGYTDRPEDFMAAADVFCLPSYREGFGMVIIEAAAAGIPSIGSRIYGITDAIEENVTGLLHPSGDVTDLAELMASLAGDVARRRTMGEAARERALRLFSREAVTQAWVDFYRQLLG